MKQIARAERRKRTKERIEIEVWFLSNLFLNIFQRCELNWVPKWPYLTTVDRLKHFRSTTRVWDARIFTFSLSCAYWHYLVHVQLSARCFGLLKVEADAKCRSAEHSKMCEISASSSAMLCNMFDSFFLCVREKIIQVKRSNCSYIVD